MNDVAVVIGCLDLYEPLWEPMRYSLSKYFGDSTWPIFWITNSKQAPCGTTISVGGDHTRWSDRMMRGLRQIKSSVILWMISDHWLSGYPDMSAIKDFAEYVRDGKAAKIRLYPGWDHDRSSGVFEHDKRLLVMGKKSPYRTSCKPSFWNRKVFLSLLRDGESPWDFERDGRKRSAKYTFLAVKNWGHFPFVTKGDPSGDWPKSPIVKGRWTLGASRYAEREGLKIDFSRHPVETNPFGDNTPSYILS